MLAHSALNDDIVGFMAANESNPTGNAAKSQDKGNRRVPPNVQHAQRNVHSSQPNRHHAAIAAADHRSRMLTQRHTAQHVA